MYCINDLRIILSPDTHIRVWGHSDKPLYEGAVGSLQSIHEAAKTTIECMKTFSNVLVFFVNLQKEIVGRR